LPTQCEPIANQLQTFRLALDKATPTFKEVSVLKMVFSLIPNRGVWGRIVANALQINCNYIATYGCEASSPI